MSGFQIRRKELQCLPIPCMSAKTFENNMQKDANGCGKEHVLLLAGGKDVNGLVVNDVSQYPLSLSSDKCIPPIPLPLRWGSLGLLGSTLLLCGGEGANEQPTSLCWSLDNRSLATARWRHHSNICRWERLML